VPGLPNPAWSICGKGGCRGIPLRPRGRCLAHAPEDEVELAFKRLRDEGVIDARGVPIDAALVERILAAAPRHPQKQDQPYLLEARFDNAVFGHEVRLVGAIFGNDARFTRAQFGNDATFDRAEFGDGARFIGASFGDEATFIGAAFGQGPGKVEICPVRTTAALVPAPVGRQFTCGVARAVRRPTRTFRYFAGALAYRVGWSGPSLGREGDGGVLRPPISPWTTPSTNGSEKPARNA
jgi:hypothetical protein